MSTIHSTDRHVVVQLPEPGAKTSPVTRRRFRRAVAIYAAIWSIAALAVAVVPTSPWSAVSIGLTLPGGGFFYGGHLTLGIASLLVFVVAVFAWWSTGPTVLPPLTLFGTAVVSGIAERSESTLAAGLVLFTVPAVLLTTWAIHRRRFSAQVRRGSELNAGLRKVSFTITGAPDLESADHITESSSEDLSRLRFALDMALQPIDGFEGFTHLDQFREGALRYQLNALSYALSMAQFTRTPAFQGYLAEGQRNAIEKMLQRKVWGYWAIENAWGNLRFDRDPVENNENVMLTGFHGLQVGMYETLNDDRYSRPGALTYQWNESTSYPNDFSTLAAAIHRNVLRSSYTLFPCEPNWIYSVCNTFGLNTLASHDRLHGTVYVDEVLERLTAAYETEFMRPDGRMVGVRSSHLGLSWNLWASSAVQTTTAYWLHAAMPELAQRTWWLLRESGLTITDGMLEIPSSLANRVDPGNYRIGDDTFAQIVTVMAAREIGDEEYAVAAENTIRSRRDLEPSGGAARWAGLSGLANHYALLGSFGRRSGLRDLVTFGVPESWKSGPVLAQAAYPDVLVARAVTDGRALHLVLRPGAGPCRTRLGVERLVPGKTYSIRGGLNSSVVADDAGRAVVEVDLGCRLDVVVEPTQSTDLDPNHER